jgi:hypothetical protein
MPKKTRKAHGLECDGCWLAKPDVRVRDCNLPVCDACWAEDLAAASRFPGPVPTSLVRNTPPLLPETES